MFAKNIILLGLGNESMIILLARIYTKYKLSVASSRFLAFCGAFCTYSKEFQIFKEDLRFSFLMCVRFIATQSNIRTNEVVYAFALLI